MARRLSSIASGGGTHGRLVRWLLANSTFAVPQAAGPIAFALLAIPLTGNPGDGAALVLAVTIAQVIGAVPVARLGRGSNAVSFLKALVAIRTLSLIAVAILAMIHAPFVMLIIVATLSGLVNGAAFGYLRSVLNHLIEPSRLPRALGLAATLNEFTFVAAPVVASGLGSINPVFALMVLTALSAAPIVLVPKISHARASEPVESRSSLLTPSILLWLGCTVANSAVASSIEVGSVSLAIRYGFAPADGFIFTLALCLASVSGGVWVSARNRLPHRFTVVLYLVLMSSGAALIALNLSVVATLVGAVMIGCVLAPLGTYYSLMLDDLSAPQRKAEVFALSRTANAIGIILTSASLTATSLVVTQAVSASLIFLATVTVATVSLLMRDSRSR